LAPDLVKSGGKKNKTSRNAGVKKNLKSGKRKPLHS